MKTTANGANRRGIFSLCVLLSFLGLCSASGANSFVEPLQNFEVVDTAVDPASGTTYVLGKNGTSAVLRRYDSAGGLIRWVASGMTNDVKTITGITPSALFVGPGTNDLFIVGGASIVKASKGNGETVVSTNGPSALSIKGVYLTGNKLFLCGTISQQASVFGITATSRGTQSAIVFTLPASLSGAAQELTTYGFSGFNSAESIVVDEAGGIYVGGQLGSGGSFASGFGLTGTWAATVAASSVQVSSLAGAVDVLSGANRTATYTANPSTINYQNSSFPGGNRDDFGFRATGVIQLTPGEYTFTGTSDDGQYLKIDGTFVFNDDSLHPATAVSGDRFIGPGLHTVEYVMFERGGDSVAQLQYKLKSSSASLAYLTPISAAGGNKGYVFKLTPGLDGLLGVYFSTTDAQSQGGGILDLHYAQGWIYAAGYWKGQANHPQIGLADNSAGGSEDVEVIKLDTALIPKGRATVKGLAENRGFGVTADDGGNVYLTGSFGNGSVDFFGEDDRDSQNAANDRPFLSLSSSKTNLFVARLNPAMNFEWAKTPRVAPDSIGLSMPRLSWNQTLQRVFWGGYCAAGYMVMGEPESEQQVDGPKGFVAVFDPDGRFTERVRLTIISAYGNSGSQVKPFGGPSGLTAINNELRIKGAEVVASVPEFIYKNANNVDLQLDPDPLTAAQQINEQAETRIASTGYSVDGNVPVGNATSYRFVIQQDTTVTFNWAVEYALTIWSDLSRTAGTGIPGATPPVGGLPGLTSQATGNPVPSAKKHWIPANDQVIASIDSEAPDLNNLSLPVKFVVTGYYGSGAVTNVGGVTASFPFYPYTGSEFRRQVPAFTMSGPARITNVWKLKIGVQVNTSGYLSAGLPLVKVLKDSPASTSPPTQADGVGTGTFYYDEHTVLQIGSVRSEGLQQLSGWFNGDETVFEATGDVSSLSTASYNTKTYSYKAVPDLVRPARVLWNYGDRIFEETVTIGNRVTFSTVDDTSIRSIMLTNEAPDPVNIVSGPAGSTGGDMGIWDDTGKKYYPLRPGTVFSYWKTTRAPADRVILRIISKYPDAPHYSHIASTPPVVLDPGTNDLVRFRELKYTESTTGAQVDSANRFLATGPGKSVLLFSEISSSGRAGPIETLRVRVVQTRLWNNQLPPAQTAVIGQKIMSSFDTAGLGTGYVFFDKARYNPFIYNRQNVSGPIIPVNLFPTAQDNGQLVVVWYEKRDKILWPYQPVRYLPAWPAVQQGLGRIVIASRFGNECVAADGTDQIVTPSKFIGTNFVPAETSFNPSRFQQVQVYNQPDPGLAGYNPNEEHALMAPSLRYAAVSPRPDAVYALRNSDLNRTSQNASYTSDPYVLVQMFDTVDQEFRMKVYAIQNQDENLNLGDLSYRYAFEQSMEAGEPVIPFYPLPFVIGATPCPGTYGKEGDPAQRTYWKDHKGTGWAVSGGGEFRNYFMYPLLPDFWWPNDVLSSDLKRYPGDCVAWLPIVPAGTSTTDKFANYLGTNYFYGVDYNSTTATPPAQEVKYTTVWPQNLPVIKVGETLTFSGGEYRSDFPLTQVETEGGTFDFVETPGLPAIVGFAAGEIVFDSKNPDMDATENFIKYTARILQPLEELTINLPLSQFPSQLQPANKRTRAKNGKWYFVDLPSSLQKRIFYDPNLGKLGISGFLNDKQLGDSTLTASPGAVYVLEPNILTPAELGILDGTGPNSPFAGLAGTLFTTRLRELYYLTRNPAKLDRDGAGGADNAYYAGLEQEIITDSNKRPLYSTNATGIVTVRRDSRKAAPLRGLGPGLALVTNPDFLDPNDATMVSYVTVAENNDPSLGGSPVTLHIIKVDKRQRYRGAIKTVLSDNVFDENIILRHTGDFGGNADSLVFEWWYRPDDGTSALPPDRQPSPSPWKVFADPSGKQGREFFQLLLKGNPSAPEALLADTLFYVRYRHTNDTVDGVNWNVPQTNGLPGVPFQWAGAGNSSPVDFDGDGFPDYRPQLAEGWVKRVLKAVNPYEARIRDFTGDNPATYSTMIQQFGQRYEGPVALNPDKNVVENVGLIELYQTVLERAQALSIDLSTPISTPGIANALQLASTRLADFYMLLGNEAYADALNPAIGFGSSSVEYGNLAPSVFAFQNQVSSLLEEELALLRGQDDYKARPVYNRLFWNFTVGEGEAAYAQNYHMWDVTLDGFIDERDGQVLYPQGHGDAWGHYLTALRGQYSLLNHPYFNWVSRSESLNLQDIVISVDYLDERKFAQVAAAKAKAGAEIVNMTYREKYVSDPNGQWQGYTDPDKNRAWGFEEWARRAGQGAYFDWITANALIPSKHPNTNLTGIAKIDRSTVKDIALISLNLNAIQVKVEEANNGNNPIGVADGAITFDIDPTFLEVGSTAQIGSRAVQGLFHFDQIFERSLQAIKNAKAAYDNANAAENMVRQVAQTEQEFRSEVYQQDLAYRNQLIEIFGSPYSGTIGSGKAYPAGYQGPDVLLYMYVDVREISDRTVPVQTVTYSNNYLSELTSDGLLSVNNSLRQEFAESFQDSSATNYQIVNYTDYSNVTNNPPRLNDSAFSASLRLPIRAAGYTFQAPAEWGQRASPGELQGLISQMVQAEAEVASSIAAWDALSTAIIRQLRLVNARLESNEDIKDRLQEHYNDSAGLIAGQIIATAGAGISEFVAEVTDETAEDIAEAVGYVLPTVGFAVSPGSVGIAQARAGIKLTGTSAKSIARGFQIAFEKVADSLALGRELVDIKKDLDISQLERDFALKEALVELENLVGDEAIKRVEIFKAIEALRELSDQYRSKFAQGIRLIQEREAFNKRTASMVQQNRYQDLSFRIARNAALEKYRSTFDLAARYTYIAVSTYDYETNLRPEDPGSPAGIFEDVIKARTIGILTDEGQPAVGGGGLCESLAVLKANYDLLKTRMGFNQPQIEFATFSMRYEKFRIPLIDNDTTNMPNAVTWQTTLAAPEYYKEDLWQVPEFRQYCRPFAASTNGPQPGLVIPFSSYILSGTNFFGWPLGGGDNAYDPSQFSTKVNSVGVWFDGYPTDELSATPRVYLVPAGMDIITVPSSQNLEVRTWRVREQSIPVPYASISSGLSNPAWRPLVDSLPTPFGEIRRFSGFRAYGYSQDDLDAGAEPEGEITMDNRLVGRSVWNTRWMLIIPGATLNADPVHGLKTLISGKLVNPADDPATGVRDGNGARDIKLVVRTYSFSGN